MSLLSSLYITWELHAFISQKGAYLKPEQFFDFRTSFVIRQLTCHFLSFLLFCISKGPIFHVILSSIIWVAMWEIVPSDMCAQRRLRSACAFAQSDQSLRCPHEEICILSYPMCVQRRFSRCSDCANVQADLNFRWVHIFEGTFPDIAARTISYTRPLFHNHIYPKCSDRQPWANSVGPDQTPQNAASGSWSTLFATHPAFWLFKFKGQVCYVRVKSVSELRTTFKRR